MVGSTTNTAAYAGNASTSTAYVIPFRFDAGGWLAVTLTSPAGVTVDLVAGEDYTLAGDGASASGTLTTTLAYSSDYTLHLWREAPGIQGLDLVANTPLPANSLEGALDRAAMAAEDSTRPRHFWSLAALVAAIKATLDALNPLHWSSIVDIPATFAPVCATPEEVAAQVVTDKAISPADLAGGDDRRVAYVRAWGSAEGRIGSLRAPFSTINEAADACRAAVGGLEGHVIDLPVGNNGTFLPVVTDTIYYFKGVSRNASTFIIPGYLTPSAPVVFLYLNNCHATGGFSTLVRVKPLEVSDIGAMPAFKGFFADESAARIAGVQSGEVYCTTSGDLRMIPFPEQ